MICDNKNLRLRSSCLPDRFFLTLKSAPPLDRAGPHRSGPFWRGPSMRCIRASDPYRAGIEDSLGFAQKLRREGWKRPA